MMSAGRGPCLLMLTCVALFFHNLDAADLWPSHEARAAQNAQRMLDDRSFGMPRLFDDQIDMQKPPAFYWLVAASASLCNDRIDRWAVRLPAALAATATVFMVWLFLAKQGRPLAGLIAGMVLATSIHFTTLARTGRIDMPLTCAITGTLLLVMSSHRSGLRILRTLIAGFCLMFAILLKGPIGLILPAGVVTGWAIWSWWRSGRWDRQGLLTMGGAGFVGLLLAGPWFYWANRETHGEFFRVFFWHHHVERALGQSQSLAVHPWWYYVPRFAFDFLPWTPLLLFGAWLRLRSKHEPADLHATLGLIWFAAVFGFLSLIGFKRADYLLPAYPGAAIFVGCVLERWHEGLSVRGRRRAGFAFLLLVSLTVGGWQWFHAVGEPRLQAVREQQDFANHIRRQCPTPRAVILFRVESHLLAYHLGRPVHTLVEWGDLNRALSEPGEHWFVTRAEFVAECQEFVVTRPLEIAARSEDFSSAFPQRPLVLMRTIDEPILCPNHPPKD